MINYIRYRKDTGVIVQTGVCADIEILKDDQHEVVIGTANDDLQYVSNGELLPYPKRPSLEHAWNGSEWVLTDPVDCLSVVRNRRNKLLSESDWTQISDAPVDKQAWADYRQALRDLPSQYPNLTDISEVVWPEQP